MIAAGCVWLEASGRACHACNRQGRHDRRAGGCFCVLLHPSIHGILAGALRVRSYDCEARALLGHRSGRVAVASTGTAGIACVIACVVAGSGVRLGLLEVFGDADALGVFWAYV